MRKILILLVFIGFAILCGGFLGVYNQWQFKNTALKTTGTIVGFQTIKKSGELNHTYAPMVSFTTNLEQPITFTSSFSSTITIHNKGDYVTVLYDPNNPIKAEIDSFFSLWTGYIIIIFLGFILFFLSGILLIADITLSKKNRVKLTKNTKVLNTTFMGVEQNSRLSINNFSPFQIISHWQDSNTNKTYTFVSDNFWYDPTYFIKRLQLTNINVMINGDDYAQYEMDLTMLPTVKNPPKV